MYMVKGQRVEDDIIFIPFPLWDQTLNLQDKKKMILTYSVFMIHVIEAWDSHTGYTERGQIHCAQNL